MNHNSQRQPITGESLSRAIIFSSFWGVNFYLLGFISQLLTFRHPPARVRNRTLLTGAGIFIGGFAGLGTLATVTNTALTKKTPSEVASEQYSPSQDGNSVLRASAGAAVGSLLPLALVAGSMRLAARLTGDPAIAPQESVSLPRAAAANALLTALAAAAVTQITNWVARDARAGTRAEEFAHR